MKKKIFLLVTLLSSMGLFAPEKEGVRGRGAQDRGKGRSTHLRRLYDTPKRSIESMNNRSLCGSLLCGAFFGGFLTFLAIVSRADELQCWPNK